VDFESKIFGLRTLLKTFSLAKKFLSNALVEYLVSDLLDFGGLFMLFGDGGTETLSLMLVPRSGTGCWPANLSGAATRYRFLPVR
jgi:hypothetical protein